MRDNYHDALSNDRVSFNTETGEVTLIDPTELEEIMYELVRPQADTVALAGYWHTVATLIDECGCEEQATWAVKFLQDVGYDLEGILDLATQVIVFEGTGKEYVEAKIDENNEYGTSTIVKDELEFLDYYVEIDYDSLIRDWSSMGEITEIETNVWVTNPYEF